MYKNLRKIATASIATSLLIGPVYFTVESGKANAETVKAVDEEMKQREKIGNALLEEIDNSKQDFKEPSVAEKLKGQVRDYKNGVAERGKATVTAKAGAKAIRATVNKIGEKA